MDNWTDLSEVPDDDEGDSNWLRTDEFHDVHASLSMLCRSLEMVTEDSLYWKWIILTTHSALQGACVCILTRTDGGGALEKNCENALLEYNLLCSQKAINEGSNTSWVLGKPVAPFTKIANLIELLRRLPPPLGVEIPKDDRAIKIQKVKDLKSLHEFRNKFTHFDSTGWSLETAGLPRIISEAVNLIEEIITHDGYRRFNKFAELDTIRLIENAQQVLSRLHKE